ncbi:11699_t:CDS:1 [Cetraspora pellucida]|uniref:11699_t:CDS:1 n=1 Tax=Cetraspora pellucida TaxID=1433469 RepID=A0ACA9LF39_9GLOM|nr:11699_t:CDS:1 [Cetraspora pellucida]
MYDSDWWKNVEQNILIGAYVMPIILYSDATLCDHLGKTSRHPVFMTLGNIPLNHHNKIDAKILLGYIPSLEYNSTSQKQSSQFRSATRKLFHRMFAAMLRPLRSLSNTGIHLYVNESLKWFYPHLALIISDWPEACMLYATYGLPNSLHPCHFCLVDCDEMNNIYLKKEKIVI